MMSISRSNLPDAAEALVNSGVRKQKSTPIEGNPNPEPKAETVPTGNRPTRANPPQPILVPGRDLPPNPQSAPSLTRYINQDIPTPPGFDHSCSSISPQMKRKRQDSVSYIPTALCPTTIGYYSPIFVGSQSFMTEPFTDFQGFQTHSVSALGVPPQHLPPGNTMPGPFKNSVASYGFHCYFDN